MQTRPLTYITWSVASADGRSHNVQLYLDVDAEWCTNENNESVVWGRAAGSHVDAMHIGSEAQEIFGQSGNSNHINWGYVYVKPRGRWLTLSERYRRLHGRDAPIAVQLRCATTHAWNIVGDGQAFAPDLPFRRLQLV